MILRNPFLQMVSTFTVVGLFAVAARAEDFATTTNLVQNCGFEAGGAGWVWAPNAAQSSGSVVTNEAHGGTHSYKLTNASGQAANVFGRVVQTVAGLQPFTTYKISCWVKGEDSGLVWIGGGPGWYLRQPFPKGTFDWTNVVTEYKTDDSPADFDLMILTESMTKAVWVDDVRMEAVSADVAARDKAIAASKNLLGGVITHLRELRARSDASKSASRDARVQLGLNVAERFIHRVETGGPDGKQAATWSRLQTQEVARVLDDTEQQIARAEKEAWKPQPWPKGDRVKLRDGLFYAPVNTGGSQPFWFYGYGHFYQIINDLTNFHGLGATLVQDGRIGPSSLNADGTFGPGVKMVLDGMDQAERAGMRVDWLLSPHYFPEWGFAQAPAARGGGPGWIQFNLDHPVARKVIGDFSEKMSKTLEKEPALLTVCLSNEATYDQSGRNAESRPDWIAWLKKTHGNIEALNTLYGTHYTNFDAVPVPGIGWKATVPENRAYYDWVRFNDQHFADWHAWMSGIVKRNLPETFTHAKIMVFYTLDRDKLHFGVDPELFCNATDLAGCDAYSFPQGDKNYDWPGNEFFYDLLHSFRGQPVFNSENHIIPDGWPPNHIPMEMTRAQLWQGGLHHQALTTIWVWEEASDSSLAGSVYFRPANVYGAGEAMLDLNRCAREVAAVNLLKPQVALLYSPASVFWEPAYKGTIMSLYTQLNFLGEPITFVSEKQLAEGKAAKVQWIVVPQATHVSDTTVAALQKFVRAGGHLLFVGERNLERDQYDRPRKLEDAIARSAKLPAASDENISAGNLRDILTASGLKLPQLADATTGKREWGVEFRTARAGGKTVVSLINLSATPFTVRVPMLRGETAKDVLSDETVALDRIQLEPMVPRLLSER